MTAPHEFRMPDVGEGIAEAEIIEWLASVGDSVQEDQPIVVVETDKSQVEIPSPFTGVVAELRGSVGDVVAVGEVIVTVTGEAARGGQPDSRKATPPADPASALASASTSPSTAPTVSSMSAASPRPLASPSTRRLAAQMGVDLTQVTGTGRFGRIEASDVTGLVSTSIPTDTASAENAPNASVPLPRRTTTDKDTAVPLRGLRRQIAKSMTESLTIPHVTEFREIDASAVRAARAALKPRFEADGIRLSVLPFLVLATVRALQRHPSFNATFDPVRGEITQYGGVHVGIATSTDDGLIVPVLRDADQLGIRQIALEIERVAELARTRKAKPSELGGAGFTISNFGSFGTWLGTPVIRHPEVGIAGFGRIAERVIPVDGIPAVRPVLPIVVAADHRINDGADLGSFVTEIARSLEQPFLLLD